MTAPPPFHPAVSEERLAAPRQKVAHVIWPDEPEGSPRATGTALAVPRDPVGHGGDGFDRRARERVFDRLPRFAAAAGHIDPHPIHRQGSFRLLRRRVV